MRGLAAIVTHGHGQQRGSAQRDLSPDHGCSRCPAAVTSGVGEQGDKEPAGCIGVWHRRGCVPPRDPAVCIIGLGIVGAIVGGYLFSFFGKEGVTGLNLYSMLVAVAGSVVVLLIYNAIAGRRPA